MKTNEDKEIDLLNYDNFRKVFLNEKTRAWLVATYLKPYTDITEEELENAEYIIDKNPEFIKEEEQPMINLYVSIDKNRKITVESTTDRPHTFLKETSKTFEKLVEHNFTDIKVIKIVFDQYNIFKADEPVLNFKLLFQSCNLSIVSCSMSSATKNLFFFFCIFAKRSDESNPRIEATP